MSYEVIQSSVLFANMEQVTGNIYVLKTITKVRL